ncbi:MAG TPA: hypothetical protein VF038_04330 [Usitatibacter sp.]
MREKVREERVRARAEGGIESRAVDHRVERVRDFAPRGPVFPCHPNRVAGRFHRTQAARMERHEPRPLSFADDPLVLRRNAKAVGVVADPQVAQKAPLLLHGELRPEPPDGVAHLVERHLPVAAIAHRRRDALAKRMG